MQEPAYELIQTNYEHLKPGDWFLPMTIKNQNQHSLIPGALDKGISGLTVEENLPTAIMAQIKDKIPCLCVPNLRDYLFSMAEKKRQGLDLQSVVIAGSMGKTTVKELVGHILQHSLAEPYHLSPENQNTKISLATQILRLPKGTQTAVFEVGARKPNDFKIPLHILKPSVVALLNIGTAHLGEFGSKENLRKEKLSVLTAKAAHCLVVPADDELILKKALEIQSLQDESTSSKPNPSLICKKKLITFGYGQGSDVQIVAEFPNKTLLNIQGRETHFIHELYSAPAGSLNIAAAVAIARALDIPINKIQESIKSFQGVSRRFQNFLWRGRPAIDDAFNSSPESLAEGLKFIAKLACNKDTLLVLGSMLELGSASIDEHKKAAQLIIRLFDSSKLQLITVGDEAKIIHDEVQKLLNGQIQALHFTTAQQARSGLENLPLNVDLVYFKGSKSTQLQTLFAKTYE